MEYFFPTVPFINVSLDRVIYDAIPQPKNIRAYVVRSV